MFYVQSQTKLNGITDGTSNTLMFSEILVVPDNLSSRNDPKWGRYSNSWTGNSLFTTVYSPNTTVADVQNYQGVTRSHAPHGHSNQQQHLVTQLNHTGRRQRVACRWPRHTHSQHH